jgi:hypothetical protein
MYKAISKSTQSRSNANQSGSQGASLQAPLVQLKVAQLFNSDPEATQEGIRFRTVSDEEIQLNAAATVLLEELKTLPTSQKFDSVMPQIEAIRLQIKQKHQTLVGIVDQYEQAAPGRQTVFFNGYFQNKPNQLGTNNLNHGQIKDLFNSIRQKTVAGGDPQFIQDDDNPQPAPLLNTERSRFLMFVLQELGDSMGVDQYETLDNNLGVRNLVVSRIGPNNLQGGLVRPVDDARSRKTDDGGAGNDQNLFNQAGSGLGYLRSKFQHGYNRTPNNNMGNIQDVQVNMDRDDDAMPFFAGVGQNDELKLFSPPKKTLVHHEIGHINSMLEGVSGSQRPHVGDLANLTDQEESYNIWGGPRSDRAYGDELGLPKRFDHSSYLAYYGDNTITHGDVESKLGSAFGFTNTIPQLQTLNIDEIRRLANSTWGKITKGVWSAPDGVKALRTLLGQNGVTLLQLQARAQQSGQNVDNDRHGFTQRFYDRVGGINVNNRDSLKTSLVALKQMVVPQVWGNGQ